MKPKTLTALSAITIGFLISCGNLHADYQSDQDVNKAAQQLKDADDAQRAADEREAQRKQLDPDDTRPRTGGEMVVLVVLMTAVGGGMIWFFNGLVKK